MICNSVNHTRFPKEDHQPDWAPRDNQVKKVGRVQFCFVDFLLVDLIKY